MTLKSKKLNLTPSEKIRILNNNEIAALRLITENPLITNVEISRLKVKFTLVKL